MAKDETTGKTAEKDVKDKNKRARVKRIGKSALSILAAVLTVVGAVLLVRDFLVEQAVEKAGSFLVGTPVRIGSFHSSLLFGWVHIKNLTVGNPEGYHHPHAFEIKNLKVDVFVPSLFTNKIEVSEISISGMNVDYELKLGTSNIGEIQSNVESFFAGEKTASTAPEEASAAPEGASDKQLVIRLFDISDSSISFSNSTLGTRLPIPLGLRLENIGDGKPIGQTLNEFFDIIFSSIGNAVGSAAGSIGGVTGDFAKSVGDSLSRLFK